MRALRPTRVSRRSQAAGVVLAVASLALVGGVLVSGMGGVPPPGPQGTTPTATGSPVAVPTSAAPARPAEVTVSSIPDLLTALADDDVSTIVVRNGRYPVRPASEQADSSLWIGSRYAGRTRPVTVRAETKGGVTFDGGGARFFGGLTFVEGAHHQTWDGFNFANGEATETGVVVFGGYSGLLAPHHISLRNIRILRSCTGRIIEPVHGNDHAIYFSSAVGGPNHLSLRNISVDGRGGLTSALHFFHSDAENANAWNVSVDGLTVEGTLRSIVVWDSTLRNIRIQNAVIRNAAQHAVRYEAPGEDVRLINIRSTGTGDEPFFSSLGAEPPGLSIIDSVLQ